MKVYLYRSNGKPQNELTYRLGIVTGLQHAYTEFDTRSYEGDVLTIHAGDGVWREYKVIAADDKMALAQDMSEF